MVFLDDLDTVVPGPGYGANEGVRRSTCAALIDCVTQAVNDPGLVVMAATDALDMVDQGVVRDGVFDVRIQVHDPDPQARRKILEKQLEGRHALTDADLDAVVARTDGRSAAYIASVVNRAAQHALHRAIETRAEEVITAADMSGAIEEPAGSVSVRLERHLSWDDLVLPQETARRLRALQHMVEDPRRVAALGIERIPRGAILFGPPRTGKTSIARVFAAQTKCSFFAISGSELITKWLGDTERRIRQLFQEAREARPAVIFIDEIDSIAATRGSETARAYDAALNQLLTELDGFQSAEGVFVLAATNRIDLLDPAIIAGGRLSERIEVPSPDRDGRRALFALYTKRMPLEPGVDLDALAGATDGMAGGDIESLCTTAAMTALERDSSRVGKQDFAAAVLSARSGR